MGSSVVCGAGAGMNPDSGVIYPLLLFCLIVLVSATGNYFLTGVLAVIYIMLFTGER